jgi:hypothetical protein
VVVFPRVGRGVQRVGGFLVVGDLWGLVLVGDDEVGSHERGGDVTSPCLCREGALTVRVSVPPPSNGKVMVRVSAGVCWRRPVVSWVSVSWVVWV